jgi:hypothetical protein
VLKGRRVAANVLAVCVPGSAQVKRAAEAAGLDPVFRDAGFEWLEPGCGMCASRGADRLANRRVISTTNRNSENREGPKTRTHLASPAIEAVNRLAQQVASSNGNAWVEVEVEVEVDLEHEPVTAPDGLTFAFATPQKLREMLLNGLDEIDLTTRLGDSIALFRAIDREKRPWAYLEHGSY